MVRFWLSIAAALAAGGTLFAAEVQVKSKGSPTPAPSRAAGNSPASPAPSRPAGTPSATPASAKLPQYRPALLGIGPTSVINRIDTAGLISDGQKDALALLLLFRRQERARSPIPGPTSNHRIRTCSNENSCAASSTAVFVPAVYEHQPVDRFFFGAVDFKVINRKPRLRIFANQEAEELKKESDFIGPQMFIGPGSEFHGLHYPSDTVTAALTDWWNWSEDRCDRKGKGVAR